VEQWRLHSIRVYLFRSGLSPEGFEKDPAGHVLQQEAFVDPAAQKLTSGPNFTHDLVTQSVEINKEETVHFWIHPEVGQEHTSMRNVDICRSLLA
jgi:hypothetical protein